MTAPRAGTNEPRGPEEGRARAGERRGEADAAGPPPRRSEEGRARAGERRGEADAAGPPPRRSEGARVAAAFLAGRTAFGLAHIAGAARDWPIPWYLPLERAFVFGPRPAGFAMEWYGRSLASLAIGAAVTCAVWLLAARGPLARALARRAFVLSVAQAAALALVVDFAYFGWVFLTQAPHPLPLPPGVTP